MSPESLSQWQDRADPSAEIAIRLAYSFLSLPVVLRAGRTCRWWAALASNSVIDLAPSRADRVLEFCLLEVLYSFDDARLPLPMSAIYGEMCAVARKSSACVERLARLEECVLHHPVGTPCPLGEQR